MRAAALGLPLAAALLLAPACRVEGQGHVPEDELRVELELRDAAGRAAERARPGEPLSFVLTVHNPGDEPLRLGFSSGKTHDVSVARADGGVVWRLSEGLVYIQMLTEIVVPARGSRELSARWDVPSDLPPGDYRARGTVPATARPLEAPTVTFAMEP